MTRTEAIALKADLAETRGKRQQELANKHGCSRSLVSDVWTERRHRNAPWPDWFRRDAPDPTDARILKLEGEIAHLKAELRDANRKVEAGARAQGLLSSVVDLIESDIPALSPLPSAWRPPKKGQIEEHLVMHLSDGHHDQVIRPEECGGLESHDFAVACARAERYVDRLLKWTQQTLANFNFPVLNVLAYGDHTSGEIHGAVKRSEFKRQIKNSLAIGQLHALMFRDLAPYFDQMNIVYVPGNHGRRTTRKDHHGAHDNWDYLVAKTAELHCRDMENVSFLIPDAFSVNLEINGVGFNVSHGDDVRSSLGIPYYGLQRRQRNLQAIAHKQDGPRIRYFVVGHFHKPGTMGDADGEMLINGPWVATDAYAYNSFCGYTEPSQWLHGVNEKHGITWRLNVRLRRETEVPERYLISV